MPQKIYTGKLSPTTTDQHLFEHFSKAGKVISAKVVVGIDGKNNAGYGYVVMNSDKEAINAINKLNNTKLDGNNINVVVAHPIDIDNSFLFRRSYKFRRR